MQTIDVKRLADEHDRNEVDFIDVRIPTEFRDVHAECARNLRLDTLDPSSVVASRNGLAERPLYVICQSGGRSAKACRKFRAAGLMFAGATGACPMASGFAKMSWN